MQGEPERTSVERLFEEDIKDARAAGTGLSRSSLQAQRSLESYLKAGNRPRWMERLSDIDAGMAALRRRLDRAHRALAEECAGDPAAFARRWRETAERWSFDEHNELVRQHNEWYPVERQLPMNPRTRDYVLVGGRDYRRRELDAAWILEEFPVGGGYEGYPRGV